MIGQYKDLLADKFISLIKCNDIVRLNLMFSLLDRVEAGIDSLLKKFEEYLLNIGIENLKMEALSIVQDSEKYIEHLLKLFNMATNLVNEAFNGDPRFLTARDMAFNLLINDKSVFMFAFSLRQQQQNQHLQPSSHSNNNESTINLDDESCNLRTTTLDVETQLEMVSLNGNKNNLINELKTFNSSNLDGNVEFDENSKAAFNNNNNNNNNNNGTDMVIMPTIIPNHTSTTTVNNKMIESRCAELFANYCDMLLRKTTLSRHLTSDQIESKLKNVVCDFP